MAGSSNTRTIRFSDQDLRDIERFLVENQIFDFSTLARTAIRQFIENPKIQIKGLGELGQNNKSTTSRTSPKKSKKIKEVSA